MCLVCLVCPVCLELSCCLVCLVCQVIENKQQDICLVMSYPKSLKTNNKTNLTGIGYRKMSRCYLSTPTPSALVRSQAKVSLAASRIMAFFYVRLKLGQQIAFKASHTIRFYC